MSQLKMSQLHRRATSRDKYACPLCHEFARTTYKAILRHIGEVHSFSPDFHIECGLGRDTRCPATYTNYVSFRSHVYKKHRDELFPEEQPVLRDEEDTSSLHLTSLMEIESDGDGPADHAECTPTKTGPDSVKQAAALFILKSMEERRMSQVYIIIVIYGL